MNKEIKKLLLVIASVILLGNIIYFSDSKLSTPQKITFENDHYKAIQNEISSLQQKLHKEMDAYFLKISDEIEGCQKESFLSSNERDELLEQLTEKYATWFVQRAEDKFKNSIWNTSDHRWMIAKINLLRNLKIQSGTKRLIEGEYEQKFSHIVEVINRYNEALTLTEEKSFISINQARNDMNQVTKFMNDPVLKNCTSLINELKEVKTTLNKKHFQYLESLLSLLNDYKKYTLTSYKQLYENICKEISDYNTYALSIYGTNTSTNFLSSTAKSKYENGVTVLSVYRERNIEYPDYQKTEKNKKCLITEVTLYKSFTKVELSFTAHPGDVIQISRATYLINHNDKGRYFLTDAVNIPYAPTQKRFDKAHFDYRITLYFQPIPLDMDYVDLVEENIDGNGWIFKDIHIIP